MDKVFREKLAPAEMSWYILNNLAEFNTKATCIEEIIDKLHKIPDHPILSTHIDYYDKSWEYYTNHSEFPDMEWMQMNFISDKPLKIISAPFSMSIYSDFVKLLDREILRLEITEKFVDCTTPDTDVIRELSSKMANYSATHAEEENWDSESILGAYTLRKNEPPGVKTFIKLLDDKIGTLSNGALSTIAAPSGNGKTTLAVSMAFNAAVFGGKCVDYLSFEVPKMHMWYNLISIESSYTQDNIKAEVLKEEPFNEEIEIKFQNSAKHLLKELDESGGYINIVDQTTLSINTYEELTAKLESIAEERGRKADLIIVDNIDKFEALKSRLSDSKEKVNGYIVNLDSFCKTYYHNEGTHICLLSQTNRDGIKKIAARNVEDAESSKSSNIDFTVIAKYNALYEKPVCVLLASSDPRMRAGHRMQMSVLKLRNRGYSSDPFILPASFEYSRVGGDQVRRAQETEAEKFTPEDFMDEDIFDDE